ncbi:hypothetical protein EX30DRAFT_374445 [Ascodesmis nigricans]|uniref:histidine kinase n=1 Tax=Ascodesmis nigricans TaxID=341454 RepID=A0A4S2MLA2_9PEZI|nr:hypothetical protein EX30DRAFT_374445 [Ascodesmis nigricans]
MSRSGTTSGLPPRLRDDNINNNNIKPPRKKEWCIRLRLREQLSIMVTVAALTAVGVLSLIFWINNKNLIHGVTAERFAMTVSMKSAQISQTFATLHHSAYSISTRPIVRNSLKRYQHQGNNTEDNWNLVEEDLLNIASARVGGYREILQIALFDVDLSNGRAHPWGNVGDIIGDGIPGGNVTVIGQETYTGRLYNGTRFNVGQGRQSSIGLVNVTGDNAVDIILPPSVGTHYTSGPMKLPPKNATLFWDEAEKNETLGLPVFDGFLRELYPLRGSNNYWAPKLAGNPDTIFTREYLVEYGGLVLGPIMVNTSLAVMSMTFPVYEANFQTRPDDLVGFATIVMNASSLLNILNDTRGMGKTGQTLLVGPAWINNLWNQTDMSANNGNRTLQYQMTDLQRQIYEETTQGGRSHPSGDYEFQFLLPPKNSPNLKKATLKNYPAIKHMYVNRYQKSGNVSNETDGHSDLKGTNSANERVGVGFMLPEIHNNLADWGIVIEQHISEALNPVTQLQKILLSAIFGTFAGVLAFVWPIAHVCVRPIVRLRTAAGTTQLCPPPSRDGSPSSDDTSEKPQENDSADLEAAEEGRIVRHVRFFSRIRQKWQKYKKRRIDKHLTPLDNNRGFVIPRKVIARRYFVHDELTELTETFNNMTDELERQYLTLEEQVQQRTQELRKQTAFAEEQRIAAEEQRKIAETANEAKSLFIANISHELRTPLNAIINMSDVAMEQAESYGAEDVKQSLELAAVAGKSLLGLITDLLTFSKNQSGLTRKIEEEDFTVEDLRKQVKAVFGKVAEEKGLKLIVETEQDDLGRYMFRADVRRLSQCLFNLVGNGLKFTPRNGFVKLRIKMLPTPPLTPDPTPLPSLNTDSPPRLDDECPESPKTSKSDSALPRTPPEQAPFPRTLSEQARTLSAQPSKTNINHTHRLAFIVSDNGPGIAPHMQKKVFEPFMQAEMHLSKRHDGVGLGLSIVRQIIDMLDGTLSLDSTPGLGSTFTIELPVGFSGMKQEEVHPEKEMQLLAQVYGRDKRPSLKGRLDDIVNIVTPPLLLPPASSTTPTPKSPPAAKHPQQSNPLRILIAEDNLTNRKVITQMLKLQHYTNVTLAIDGLEALTAIRAAMASNNPYGIILMDIQMPRMDGITCTRKARALGYPGPIVALSAFANGESQRECLDAGMNYFLAKPVDKKALRIVLGVCTGGRVTPEEEEEERKWGLAGGEGDDGPRLRDLLRTPGWTPREEGEGREGYGFGGWFRGEEEEGVEGGKGGEERGSSSGTGSTVVDGVGTGTAGTGTQRTGEEGVTVAV